MNKIRLRIFILALGDFAVFYGTLIAIAFAYQLCGGQYEMSLYFKLWKLALVFIISNAFIKLYHGNIFYPGVALNQIEELRRLSLSIILTILLLSGYSALIKEISIYSRFVVIFSGFISSFLTLLTRNYLRNIMKKYHLCEASTIVICHRHQNIKNLLKELKNDKQMGLNIISVKKISSQNHHNLETISKTKQCHKIDYAIIILPPELVKKNIHAFTLLFKHLMVIPPQQIGYSNSAYHIDINGIGGTELKNQLLLKGPRVLKIINDYLFALIATIIVSPALILIAIAIKTTSKGSIFYHATRLGQHGKKIKILKFRTMYADADERLQELLKNNPLLAKEWHDKFKLTNDPRITPLGKLLRKTSLDELPQFINVLQGKMSVIGPRPIIKKELKYYQSNYDIIARVKPGITGFWQVSGRSNTTYEQRVRYDLYYITNWSLWLDYFIFLKTIKEIIFCTGAK